MKHEASDGSLWHITNTRPPVPNRNFDWEWVSDDYDGAPDAYDDRHGYEASEQACKNSIEDWIVDYGDDVTTFDVFGERFSH